MISFAHRQTTAHRNRELRADMVQLLARARASLRRWHELHTLSVTIGRLESIADSGVCAQEIEQARKIVEDADRLTADIDRVVFIPTPKDQTT